MKKYVAPIVEFIKLDGQMVTENSGPCNDNYVCPQDSGCPTYVCPTMYGNACGQNPYNMSFDSPHKRVPVQITPAHA